MANADVNDLTPETQAALAQMKARLAAQGYAMGNPISGFRTYADQQQLQANMLAGMHGQPLPYPNRGAIRVAAKPGYSPHEFGVAFDTGLSGPALATANQIAPSIGLSTVGGDPGHFQLANWRMTKPLGPNDQPPGLSLASSYANPPSVAPAANAIAAMAAPGNLNPPLPPPRPVPAAGSHSQFITDYARQQGVNPNLALGIANAEGLRAWSPSNPNAASYVDRTNGQPFSFGDFQLNIHPGAVGAAAKAAGIDVTDPKQWQAADKFAIDYMKQHGVGAWSGDPVAKAYLASGKVPSIQGVTGPIDPTIAAGGPGAAGTPTAPSTTPMQTVGNAIASLTQPGAPATPGGAPTDSPLQKLTKDLDPNQQKQQGGGGQQGGPQQDAGLQLQQAAAAQGNMRQQQIAMQAQQLAALMQQKAMRPLTWGPQPYGSDTGQTLGAPGTTLNSIGG